MSTRTIQQIESEIQAIKYANPNWAGNQIVLGAITALKNEKNHLSQPPQVSSSNDSILESLLKESFFSILEMKESFESMQITNNALLALMVGVSAPVPVSTQSQRQANQDAFKEALKARYPHCVTVDNATSPSSPLLRCMILDHAFSPDMITARHIIGLTNPQSFPVVGLNYSNHRYHERNGLLIFRDIAQKYGNQVITFIYNPVDHLFRLQVLFDDVLDERVGNLTKGIINAIPADDPLTYRDINGRSLILPDLTRQPFRRALVYMAKTACTNALESPRPHNCLLQLGFTEERWGAILASIRIESTDFGESPLGKLQNLLAEV